MMADRYTGMKRRTFVASGVGLGTTVAGCLSDGSTDGNDPVDDEGNGNDGSSNEADDPGDGPDGNRTTESEDPPGEGNDSDGAEGDGPDGQADRSGYTVSLEDGPVEVDGEFARLRVELVDSHVEPESQARLEATLTNTAEETIKVSSGAPSPFGVVLAEPDDGEGSIALWTDAYEASEYVGTDGKRVEGVDDITVGEGIEAGESIARTLEIHEETPGLEAGTYTASIGSRINFREGDDVRSPDESENLETGFAFVVERGLSDSKSDDEDARIDNPPYEIEKPEAPHDPAENDDWNEDYLGKEMSEKPSIGFEELEGVGLKMRALSIEDDEGDQYAVHLVESEGDLEERLDREAMGPEDRERVEAVDLDEQLVVVVESGFGSGSVRHRWKRVEDVKRGVHLHGYYTQPYERTSDYAARHSMVVVERPDGEIGLVRASLTVSPERRIHLDSTEEIVTVDPE